MTDQSVTPKLIATTIDCNDLEAMTTFWSSLLAVESEIHEPYGFLAPTEGRQATIWLQRVPEQGAGKNRLHLDFVVQDLDEVAARVVELGGSVVGDSGWQDFVWNTFADLEGNLFDIMAAPVPDDG